MSINVDYERNQSLMKIIQNIQIDLRFRSIQQCNQYFMVDLELIIPYLDLNTYILNINHIIT